MINNFNILSQRMKFNNDNDYYYIQILKRKKDNPDMERSMIVLKDIYVHNHDQFQLVMPRITALCDAENARAYFRINRRNAERTALEALKLTATYIASGDYTSVKNAWSKAAGRFHSDTNKQWIIDLDDYRPNEVPSSSIFQFIRELVHETGRPFIFHVIPTPNGAHLLCPPFNLAILKRQWPNIDVHKDNPTILYSPEQN